MRRWTMVVAVLAWAGVAVAQGDTREETKEAGRAASDDAKQGTKNAQDWSKRQADAAGQKMDETSQQMKKDAFDIDGKIAKASKSQVSLTRKGNPPATLHIDKTTKVEVDGQQASAQQLKPGQDVKASFNLKGDKPTAVEIKAESKK